MIHGHKIKIKSLREDLKEVELLTYEAVGQLRRDKSYLGFEEYNRLKRLSEQLTRTTKKLKGSIRSHKREIRKIKLSKMSYVCGFCGKKSNTIKEGLNCECGRGNPINNKNKRNLLIVAGITIILFISFAGIMVKMIQENGECIDNPFKYSATKLKESGGNYLCSCSSLDAELWDFSFDEEGINIIKPVEFEELDLSKINFTEMKGGK